MGAEADVWRILASLAGPAAVLTAWGTVYLWYKDHRATQRHADFRVAGTAKGLGRDLRDSLPNTPTSEIPSVYRAKAEEWIDDFGSEAEARMHSISHEAALASRGTQESIREILAIFHHSMDILYEAKSEGVVPDDRSDWQEYMKRVSGAFEGIARASEKLEDVADELGVPRSSDRNIGASGHQVLGLADPS